MVLQAEMLAYNFLHQKHEIIYGNFSVKKTFVENKPCARHQNNYSNSLIHSCPIFTTQLSDIASILYMREQFQKDYDICPTVHSYYVEIPDLQTYAFWVTSVWSKKIIREDNS